MRSLLFIISILLTQQILTAQCYLDRHNTTWYDAWTSCETSPNPNTARDDSHWLQYDLGHFYVLKNSQFWNSNRPEFLQNGLKDIVIDISLDGENWIEWGEYSLAQATGENIYEGEIGPHFSDAMARYVLITALDNHGGDCFSLSEMRINVESAPVFVSINAKAKLAAAYDPSNGLMRDSLRTKNLLPNTEPYAEDGFPVSNPTDLMRSDLTATSGNTAVIDWVIVELRDKTNPANIVSSKSAVIRRDGSIMEKDGVSSVFFKDIAPDEYYVAVRHRNHLGVMSAAPLTLGTLPIDLDFSDPNTLTWGTHARYVQTDVALMWGGDLNQDGQIIYQGADSDLLPVTIDVYSNIENTEYQASFPITEYLKSDGNMDGQTIYQGAASDLLPVTISVYSNPANVEYQASFPVFEQLPD